MKFDINSIKTNIENACEYNGVNISELPNNIEENLISRKRIEQELNGEVPINVSTISRICDYLGYTFSDLIEGKIKRDEISEMARKHSDIRETIFLGRRFLSNLDTMEELLNKHNLK